MIKFLATTLALFGILVSQGHGYGGGYGGSYGGHYGGHGGGQHHGGGYHGGGYHGGGYHGGGYHGGGYGYHDGHGGGNHGSYHEGGHGVGDYDHHGGYVGIQHGSAHYGIGYGGYNHGQKHLKQITEKTTEAPKQVTESGHSNVIMEQAITALVTDNSSGNEGSGFSNMQFEAVAAVETQETASAAGQKSYKLENNGDGFSNDKYFNINKSDAVSMTEAAGTLNASNLETVISSQPTGTATQQVSASVQTASEASTAVSSSGNEQSGFANKQFGAVNQQTVLATQQIASTADHRNYKNDSHSGVHTDYKHDFEAKTSNSDETEASATKKINAVNSKSAYSSQQTGTATQQVGASIPKTSGSTHNGRDDQIDIAFINQEVVTSEQSGFPSHKSVDSSSKHIIEKTTEALKKAAESKDNAVNKDTNTSNEAIAGIATDSSSENEQSGFTNTKLGAVNQQTAEANKQTTSPTDHKNYKHGSCSGSYSNYKNFDNKTSNAEVAKSPETLKINAGKLEPVFGSQQTGTAMQQVGSSVQITDEASIAIATENSSRNEQSVFTNIQFGAGNQQTALSTQQTASVAGHKNYEHGSYGGAHTDYKHDFETKTSNTATKSSAVKNINAGDLVATYDSQQTGTQKVSASIPTTSESTQNNHDVNQKYFVFVNQEGEASEQSGFQSHKSVEVSSKHIGKTTEAPKEAAESKYEEHTNTANEASAAIATESSSGNMQSGYANTQFGAVVQHTAIQTQGIASAESQKNYEHGSYGGAHNDYKHDFQTKTFNTGVTESSAVKKINAGNSEVTYGSQQTGTATQKVSASIPTTSESVQNVHDDQKYFAFVNQKGEASEQSGFQSHKSVEVSSKHTIEKTTEAPKEAAESKYEEHTNTDNEASAAIAMESSSGNMQSGYANTQFGAVVQHTAIQTQGTASAESQKNYEHGSYGGAHNDYKHDFQTKTSNTGVTESSAVKKINAGNSEVTYGSQQTGTATQKVSASIPTTSESAQNVHDDQKYFAFVNQKGEASEQSGFQSHKSVEVSSKHTIEKTTEAPKEAAESKLKEHTNTANDASAAIATESSSGNKESEYANTQFGDVDQHSAVATQQTASAAGHTNYKHGSYGAGHTNYKVAFETKTSNAETTDDTASASPKFNANNSEAAYGSQKTSSAIQTTSSGAQNKDQKYEHQSPSGHQYGGLLVKQFVLRNQEGVANEQSDSSSQKSGVASQNSSGEKITYSATQSGSETQQVNEGKDKSTTSGVASQNSSGEKITYSATQSGSATQQVTEGKDKSTTSGVANQNSSGEKITYSATQSGSATQQVTEGKDKSTTSGVASQNSSGEKITYSGTQSGSAIQQVTEGKDKSTTSQQNVEISQEAETEEKQVFDISSTDDENSHSDERETYGGNHKSHGKSNHGGHYTRRGGYGGYGGYHHRRRGYGHGHY